MNRVFPLVLLAAFLSGCASTAVCLENRPMTIVENSGWFLFNFIPLGSGEPDEPNENAFRIFSDSVTLENNMRLLDHAIREAHAVGYRNATSYTTDENVLVLLLKRRTYHTSAELVMPGESGASE